MCTGKRLLRRPPRALQQHLSLEQLGLPDVVREISELTTRTGAGDRAHGIGKTTTPAALLNHINQQRAEHILTVEDPIEFVYQSARSVIHQRGSEDTRSFANALGRAAGRP